MNPALIQPAPDILILLLLGCRLGRSWFIVKETKSEKKLLVLTKKSSDCCLSLTPTTIQLLRDLFGPLSRVGASHEFSTDFLKNATTHWFLKIATIVRSLAGIEPASASLRCSTVLCSLSIEFIQVL
jgi:hypothetical protein